MRFPDGSTVKRIERLLTRGHIVETAQPDKSIQVIEIVKLTDDLDAHSLLCFDKFTVEEFDQFIAPAWIQCVLPEFDNWRIGGFDHTRSNSMIQLVSQVLPPSSENAC